MNRYLKYSIGIFIPILVLTQFLAYQQYRIAEAEQSKQLVDELNTVSERLKKTLSYSLAATSTLAFIVEKYGYPDDFETLARDILSSHDYIDALELTRGGVITDVFPLTGNEEAVGLDVINYRKSSAEALEAIERGKLFFAGPLELVQGGVAILGRLPMYRQEKFIGFAVAIVKLQTLINAIGVAQSGRSDLIYQLSKINPVSGEEEFFLEGPINKNIENAMSVNIADGEWMLYVSPLSNFPVYQQAIGYSIFGIILSVISGMLFYQWARQPEKLNKLVEQKTRELKHEKDLSDNIINSLPGLFFLFDKKGQFLRWNRYTEILSGKTPGEVMQKLPQDFFKDGTSGEIISAIQETFQKGQNEIETTLLLPNGEKVPYYFYARKIELGKEEYLIGIGIDISDRKKAQEEATLAAKEKEVTLNRISDGVVSFDVNWNFLFINEAATEYFRDGAKKVLGKNLLELSPKIVETPFWEALNKSLVSRKDREIESYYEPIDKWLSVKIYPSENGLTVFFRDVTNVRNVERETMRMIGRELHDNVVQVLTGASLFLNAGIRKSGIASSELAKVDELISKSIEEIRMLSHDLISPFSEGATLENAVRELFEHAAENANFATMFEFNGLNEALLSDKLKTSIFRIVQEQCNNILKYANPDQVTIRISMKEDHLTVDIKDDGVGFDPDIRSNGIGFVNIRSRTSLFNGKMNIVSSPGKGCELKVCFPLPEQVAIF